LDPTTVETQTALDTTLEELMAPYLTLEAKHGLALTQTLGLAAAFRQVLQVLAGG
jgi:hypothetical protein